MPKTRPSHKNSAPSVSTNALLNQLERIKSSFGPAVAVERMRLIREISRRKIFSAADLIRFHDLLCVVRAYPDNQNVLKLAETELIGYGRRVADYKRLTRDRKGGKLDDTAIEGSITCYQFNFDITRYLHARYPDRFSINWEHTNKDFWFNLGNVLSLLVTWEENDPIDNDENFDAEESFRRSGGGKNELATLINLFAGSGLPLKVIRDYWENLGLLLDWDLTKVNSARNRHRIAMPGRFFQTEPLKPRTKDLRLEIAGAPTPLRLVPRREGEQLLNDINEALGVRNRELFPLTFGNPSEVYTADLGRGSRIVLYGSLPEARLPLESNFGALLVRNGMPVGYGVAALLADRAEIAINIFPTYRGGESPFFLEQFFRLFYHHFGSRVFVVRAKQMGYGEDEALLSGAFWFYYKLGFRAVDKQIRRLAEEQYQKIQRRPDYRVPTSTMRRLSKTDVFFSIDPAGMKEYRELSIINLGYRVTEFIGKEYVGDRNAAVQGSVALIEKKLGNSNTARWSEGEKLSLVRLAPLFCLIPDLSRWSREEKQMAVELIRAKGGATERAYVLLMNRHSKLRAALERLAR
jgi:hypothetical protein